MIRSRGGERAFFHGTRGGDEIRVTTGDDHTVSRPRPGYVVCGTANECAVGAMHAEIGARSRPRHL